MSTKCPFQDGERVRIKDLPHIRSSWRGVEGTMKYNPIWNDWSFHFKLPIRNRSRLGIGNWDNYESLDNIQIKVN